MQERARTTTQHTIPKFGAVQDRMGSFGEHGLIGEMYVCYRWYLNEPQEVRILHLSTNLVVSRPEVVRVIEYMNSVGFVCTRKYVGKNFHKEWIAADVLLFGCESKHTTHMLNAMDEMERGLHGVLREWDVLRYFMDDRIPQKSYLHLDGSDMCVTSQFSQEAIHMIHAHLRRRHDLVAQRGLFDTLEQWIADGIDLIIPPKQKWDTTDKKISRLEKHIGTGGRDRDLFFAVADFLIGIRNRSAHPNVDSSFNSRMSNYQDLKKKGHQYGFDIHLAARHDCPIRQDGEPSCQDRHAGRRGDVVLARMARAWLNDYAAANTSNKN